MEKQMPNKLLPHLNAQKPTTLQQAAMNADKPGWVNSIIKLMLSSVERPERVPFGSAGPGYAELSNLREIKERTGQYLGNDPSAYQSFLNDPANWAIPEGPTTYMGVLQKLFQRPPKPSTFKPVPKERI